MTFAATSRYYATDTTTLETVDGTVFRYLRRRFLPALDRFTLLQQYQVTEGDRLDNVTAKFLRDPEQFWRLCDANPVMNPVELEKLGTRIRITLPEGIPGAPSA
jgi:hypothetical protein